MRYLLTAVGLLVSLSAPLARALLSFFGGQAVGKDCVWMLQLVFLIIKLDGDVRYVCLDLRATL